MFDIYRNTLYYYIIDEVNAKCATIFKNKLKNSNKEIKAKFAEKVN